MMMVATASVILFLLQLGLIPAFQQKPANSLSYKMRNVSPHHHPASCQWSAPVEQTLHLTEATTRVDYDWDEQFEELLLFQKEYGQCNFPHNARPHLKARYPTLQKFCYDQRLEYQRLRKSLKNSDKMTLATFDLKVRLDRLEESGFGFDLEEWNNKYNELIAFREEHGSCRVTQKNLSLSKWIYRQRSKREKGKLTIKQIRLLDDIEFPWESKAFETQWYANYNALVDFQNQHGHLLVERGTALYKWSCNQRARRTCWKGAAPLSEEKIRLLDSINFAWKPDRLATVWLARYNELVQFQQAHGHCQPKLSVHQCLYSWSKRQQRAYEEGLLSTEQIKLLDKIDFRWNRKPVQWKEMYKQLTEFLNEHGHLRVSQDDDPDLYDWMTTQRKLYHGGTAKHPKLPDVQIESLEELHFCWSQDWRERTWHEKYTEMAEFCKEHGHARVTKKDSASLYNWIQTQEKRYKKMEGQKPLSDEEMELLEHIDFPFLKNQPHMAWNEKYAAVVRYQNENKGSFPTHPTHSKDGHDLSLWMRQQRKRMRSSYGYVPLSDEQEELLGSIDFPMYPTSHQWRLWYPKYDELAAFRKQHGHFLVGRKEDKSLFRWINRQRMRYSGSIRRSDGGPLSKSQTYLLERIGFPWTSNRYEIEWQLRYDELVQFLVAKRRFPRNESDHPVLNSWMKNQRKRYNGTGVTDLSEGQIKQLEKIGFRWSLEA